MSAHDYAFWHQQVAGTNPELPERAPQCGFYRHAGRDGLRPVAIWRNGDGDIVARVGANGPIVEADEEWGERYFAKCCRHAVTEEAYRDACAGKPWPDVDPVVHANPPKRGGPGAGFGDNSGATNPAEVFRDQVHAAVEGAKAYAEVADDEVASRAQSLRSRLLELAGEGTEAHRVEKEPHLAACREIDAKWLRTRDAAKGTADTIRAALTRWENEKLRRDREERKRLAEEARKNAPVDDVPAALVAAAPTKPAQVRGGYGRAAPVKTVFVAVVEDQDAAYGALRTNPEIVNLIQKLADKVIKVGGTMPGVRADEQRKVA